MSEYTQGSCTDGPEENCDARQGSMRPEWDRNGIFPGAGEKLTEQAENGRRAVALEFAEILGALEEKEIDGAEAMRRVAALLEKRRREALCQGALGGGLALLATEDEGYCRRATPTFSSTVQDE